MKPTHLSFVLYFDRQTITHEYFLFSSILIHVTLYNGAYLSHYMSRLLPAAKSVVELYFTILFKITVNCHPLLRNKVKAMSRNICLWIKIQCTGLAQAFKILAQKLSPKLIFQSFYMMTYENVLFAPLKSSKSIIFHKFNFSFSFCTNDRL